MTGEQWRWSAFWQGVHDCERAAKGSHCGLSGCPAFAPEVNPAEGVGYYLKHRELGNGCCYNPAELRQEGRGATRRKISTMQGKVVWISAHRIDYQVAMQP
jgi:hypothetical protein